MPVRSDISCNFIVRRFSRINSTTCQFQTRGVSIRATLTDPIQKQTIWGRLNRNNAVGQPLILTFSPREKGSNFLPVFVAPFAKLKNSPRPACGERDTVKGCRLFNCIVLAVMPRRARHDSNRGLKLSYNKPNCFMPIGLRSPPPQFFSLTNAFRSTNYPVHRFCDGVLEPRYRVTWFCDGVLGLRYRVTWFCYGVLRPRYRVTRFCYGVLGPRYRVTRFCYGVLRPCCRVFRS